MAQPVQNIFQALDQALAAAVATAGRSVVQVSRGHGASGTGIAWADDLVISSSFHTPDRTKVGIASGDGQGDEDPRDATRGGVNRPAQPAERGREGPLWIDRRRGLEAAAIAPGDRGGQSGLSLIHHCRWSPYSHPAAVTGKNW